MFGKFISLLRERRKTRCLYSARLRDPFFHLAEDYLPEDKEATILDIGCGAAYFADTLSLGKKYKNLYLLDANPETIKGVSKKYENALVYRVPDNLPFKDNTVDFVHSSHLVEHLSVDALYSFLQEVNRVIKPGGCFVVSAPYLTPDFYNDLSHLKPYNPNVFLSYLCANKNGNRTRVTAENFIFEKLVWRYARLKKWKTGEGVHHRLAPVDACVLGVSILLHYLGFISLQKDGFTLILRKSEA